MSALVRHLCLCGCADAKVSGGAAPLRIDEIAYNAVAVVWNTRDKRVKVPVVHFANDNINIIAITTNLK